MKLYEPFPDRITVEGQEFRLTLWFDRVLRFYDVLDDPDLTPEEKTEAGFSWLVDCRKAPPPEVQSPGTPTAYGRGDSSTAAEAVNAEAAAEVR